MVDSIWSLCLQPKNWLVPHLEEKFFLKAAEKKMAVVYHISSIARVVPSISVIRWKQGQEKAVCSNRIFCGSNLKWSSSFGIPPSPAFRSLSANLSVSHKMYTPPSLRLFTSLSRMTNAKTTEYMVLSDWLETSNIYFASPKPLAEKLPEPWPVLTIWLWMQTVFRHYWELSDKNGNISHKHNIHYS